MNKTSEKPTFYCIKEASAASGLSLAQLYQLARLGEIPHFYQGYQLRFNPTDLQRYIQQKNK